MSPFKRLKLLEIIASRNEDELYNNLEDVIRLYNQLVRNSNNILMPVFNDPNSAKQTIEWIKNTIDKLPDETKIILALNGI